MFAALLTVLLLALLLAPLVVAVVLVARGRLFAGLLTPLVLWLAAAAARGGAENVPDMLRNPLWMTGAAVFVTACLVLSWPWLRARTLHRRAFSKRRSELNGGEATLDPDTRPSPFEGTTLLERWIAAGHPRRALIKHAKEALDDAPVAAERSLDEALAIVDPLAFELAPGLDQATWSRLATSGLLGLGIDEAHGGAGLDAGQHSDFVARAASRAVEVAEALALSGPGSAADLLTSFGTDAQQATLLPRIARGELIAALSWTGTIPRDGVGFAMAKKRKVNGKERLGFVLRFKCEGVEFGSRAGLIAVALPTSDPDGLLRSADDRASDDSEAASEPAKSERGTDDVGTTCFLVPTSTPGLFGFEDQDRVGTKNTSGRIGAKGVFIPLNDVLGGADAVGSGAAQVRWSESRLSGWRTASITAGVSELAAHAALSWMIVQNGETAPKVHRSANLAAALESIDAVRRSAAARIDVERVEFERGTPAPFESSALTTAGHTALLRSSTVLQTAAAAMGVDLAGFVGKRHPVSRIADWPMRAAAERGSLESRVRQVITLAGRHRICLEQLLEDDAVRAQDRTLFDRVRTRRTARRIALEVRAAWRRTPLNPWRKTDVTHGIDDLGIAFALYAGTFASRSSSLPKSKRCEIELHLGLAFAAIAEAMALLEIDEAGGTQPTEANIVAHATRSALEAGADALLDAQAIFTWRNRSVRLGAALARCIKRAVQRDLQGRRIAAAGDVIRNHDARTRLTSNVFIPGADDTGLGALDRAARLAFVSAGPLARVARAIQAGQISNDPAGRSVDAPIDDAVRLEIISEADRQNILAARAARSGLTEIEARRSPSARTKSSA